MENELAIGSVGASLFLSVILGLIYGTIPKMPNLLKPWIAIIVGIGFALLYMIYNDIPFEAKQIINFGIQGFMIGATAVGLNELGGKKFTKMVLMKTGDKDNPVIIKKE